ncbi:response regulator transcription factor [Paenibacillus sp. MBLB4367]|uniref:response regulator transcription factor n=1 Tax=Paenibacillus sp. MBLB4367 TaxID=3384767 RepID=UPI00390804F0
MSENILIVDDEQETRWLLEQELAHDGYAVGSAATGREGLDQALSGSWDLILLDVILPELSGMEVLRRLRAAGKGMPIIMVSGRSATPDKVAALDQGANDYITKPFAIEELLARIRACLRHARASYREEPDPHPHVLQIDKLEVDTKARTVVRCGQPIDLTPKEFDLLVYMLERAGEVIRREELIQQVWGYDFVGDTNITDVYIGYLRKKIDQNFRPSLIHTVRGVGYCLRISSEEDGSDA